MNKSTTRTASRSRSRSQTEFSENKSLESDEESELNYVNEAKTIKSKSKQNNKNVNDYSKHDLTDPFKKSQIYVDHHFRDPNYNAQDAQSNNNYIKSNLKNSKSQVYTASQNLNDLRYNYSQHKEKLNQGAFSPSGYPYIKTREKNIEIKTSPKKEDPKYTRTILVKDQETQAEIETKKPKNIPKMRFFTIKKADKSDNSNDKNVFLVQRESKEGKEETEIVINDETITKPSANSNADNRVAKPQNLEKKVLRSYSSFQDLNQVPINTIYRSSQQQNDSASYQQHQPQNNNISFEQQQEPISNNNIKQNQQASATHYFPKQQAESQNNNLQLQQQSFSNTNSSFPQQQIQTQLPNTHYFSKQQIDALNNNNVLQQQIPYSNNYSYQMQRPFPNSSTSQQQMLTTPNNSNYTQQNLSNSSLQSKQTFTQTDRYTSHPQLKQQHLANQYVNDQQLQSIGQNLNSTINDMTPLQSQQPFQTKLHLNTANSILPTHLIQDNQITYSIQNPELLYEEPQKSNVIFITPKKLNNIKETPIVYQESPRQEVFYVASNSSQNNDERILYKSVSMKNLAKPNIIMTPQIKQNIQSIRSSQNMVPVNLTYPQQVTMTPRITVVSPEQSNLMLQQPLKMMIQTVTNGSSKTPQYASPTMDTQLVTPRFVFMQKPTSMTELTYRAPVFVSGSSAPEEVNYNGKKDKKQAKAFYYSN